MANKIQSRLIRPKCFSTTFCFWLIIFRPRFFYPNYFEVFFGQVFIGKNWPKNTSAEKKFGRKSQFENLESKYMGFIGEFQIFNILSKDS